MVYYFVSNVTDPPATIYVGKDKFENEELIKYGWEEDFHVDNLSSAHVYLRMSPTQTWDHLPQALLDDCAQLTKANSIEGNKKDNITILYTPHSNLLKTPSMPPGQVTFHNRHLVRTLHLPTRLNPTINRLAKTRLERPATELPALREAHLAAQRKRAAEEKMERKREEERVRREGREEKERRRRGWEEVFGEEAVRERGVVNSGVGEGEGEGGGWDEDDFM